MKRIDLKVSKGFTLVELVIVIAIVIVLSVVSVPIYRSYVNKAKYTEGYALLGTILTAQKTYYAENGFFWGHSGSASKYTYNSDLGIDTRGNKYFSSFYIFGGSAITFRGEAVKNEELRDNGKTGLVLYYNITSGTTLIEI